jgi:thiamine-phosphate pyrophosphorylase
MHIKSLKKYFFIDEFNYSHFINLDKNISFIWRNKDKETKLATLIKLKNFCKRNNRQFFISNNIKLAIKINADGVYIPSTNKSLNVRLINSNKKFKILGSAHNFKEIKIKEMQKIEEVFISPLFKKKSNQKLDIYKYLNLKKITKLKDISLGGINNQNIKKLKFIKPTGFAAISYFKKKGL